MCSEIIAIMRDHWDLPPDCNEGELFTYAEILFDRIEAGEQKRALYAFLAEVQAKLDIPESSASREIIDRAMRPNFDRVRLDKRLDVLFLFSWSKRSQKPAIQVGASLRAAHGADARE